MKTYAELAASLNVSTATVCNALSGKGRMKPELRLRIIKAAEQADFERKRRRPVRSSRYINIITEELISPFCSQIITGITDRAKETGIITPIYSLSIRGSQNSEFNNEKLKEQLNQLLPMINTYCDGIIYVSQYPRDLANLFPVLPCPIVYTYGTATENTYSVLCDDEQGAFLATSHLIEIGRHRLAMICGPIDNFPTSNRFIGFQRAMIANGLSFHPHMIRIGDWGVEGGYDAMKELLAAQSIPDAIFSHNDKMAIGALKAIVDAGLSVPEDIAIVGFDNFTSRYTTPGITSVQAPLKEVGESALSLLQKILNGEAPKQHTFRLPCELAVRVSTIGT